MKDLCTICPRGCKIDRKSAKGFCNENKKIRVAKILKHFKWEEPCLCGKGCLAIFFSGCNLRCDYCQNYEISRGGVGKEYSADEFANLIKENLTDEDFIDLITPTHFSHELEKAFSLLNLNIPVIWNTNGYETEENIERVSKFVDVFLTDFKYAENTLAQKYSKCSDYVEKTLLSTKKMCDLKPDIFENELLKQGVVIRHLVLPNHVSNSLKVLDIIKANFPNRKVSVMSQFTPNGKSSLNRKITKIEYKLVLSHMEKLGLENGYFQEFDSANECFIPNFEQND